MSRNKFLFLATLMVMAIGVYGARALAAEPNVPAGNGPVPGSKVLVIFVDSLRPDIVDEMVARGDLPTIQKLFYDRGLRFDHFYSIFPSLTVCAYSSLITGKWQDQSGLKAQSLFERFPTRKRNILKRIFTREDSYPRFFNMLTKVEKAPEILKQNKIKAFYDYLGEKYHTALVPVSPSVLPWAWPHIAANDVERPHYVATEAVEMLDDLNGKYALRYMVPDTRGKLFIVWFTQLDEEQHRHDSGQWAPAVQEKMRNVDQWLSKIYDGLVKESQGRLPYVVLFSDHGAYGGKDSVYNQPYYIGRDYFYKTLKMNVRGPDFTISHPGTDLNTFTYVDNMGRGQACIFLPVGDSLTGNWERPNTFYELTHYGLGPNRKPVNLIRGLLGIDLEARNKFPGKTRPHPVDLLFVKISEQLIYIAKQGGAEALLRISRQDGKYRYCYQPVRNFAQSPDGQLSYDEVFTSDPFGYLAHPKFRAPDPLKFFRGYHDDQEWFEATCETDYPDAITALSHALLWRPELSHLAQSQDPDIWISAAPGWNFRIEDINGADHGAILGNSLKSTLMLTGPNIRKGTDPTPHRIIDLTPTLLQLIGYKGKTELDAAPIEGIYADA